MRMKPRPFNKHAGDNTIHISYVQGNKNNNAPQNIRNVEMLKKCATN